jgi:hypothetical protein
MSARRRDPVASLERQRGFAWYRFYRERERADMLEDACEIMRDRIDTLVPEFLALIDSVLYERNAKTFARAHRLQALLLDYLGGPHGQAA